MACLAEEMAKYPISKHQGLRLSPWDVRLSPWDVRLSP
jgi:hypothetical protein